jgi:hypothetical protein
MKTYWGGEWSASRPGRIIPRERGLCTHWIGGLVGPRAVLDAVVKRKIPSPRRKSNPRTPIVQPVAQRYTDWAIAAYTGAYTNGTGSEGVQCDSGLFPRWWGSALCWSLFRRKQLILYCHSFKAGCGRKYCLYNFRIIMPHVSFRRCSLFHHNALFNDANAQVCMLSVPS